MLFRSSCKTKQAITEKVSVQESPNPKEAPAFAAVVMVPGPTNAAEIMDQKRMFNSFFFMGNDYRQS